MTDLAYLTVAEGAQLLRRKKLSPVEWTKALLDRIAAIDSNYNAFLVVTADKALAQAKTAEAEIARGYPADITVREEDHWEAMQAVDRAIVFGFRAAHSGLVVPNDLIAAHVAKHPEKLIGFSCIDPWEKDYLDEMHRTFEDMNFRGLKLAPIYQNYHPMDERMQTATEGFSALLR